MSMKQITDIHSTLSYHRYNKYTSYLNLHNLTKIIIEHKSPVTAQREYNKETKYNYEFLQR